MNVGIPGMGLGGLFFIISALLMPVFELARTLRGRSSVAHWRFVGRQFGMAVGIVLATASALWFFGIVVRGALAHAVGGGPVKTFDAVVRVLPVAPVVGTLLVLALLLAVAEALRWLVVRRSAVKSSADSRKRHT